MPRPIKEFTTELWKEWVGLMSCAAFTFLGVYIALAEKKNPWVVAASLVLAVAFFVIASYRIWKRQYEAAVGLQQQVNHLEKAVFSGPPVVVPSTMHVQQRELAKGEMGGKITYTIRIIVAELPITTAEIAVVFTWPVVHILASITQAKHPDTVEARNNSRDLYSASSGPYGCRIPIGSQIIIEKSLVVLYVTSYQPCCAVSVRALDSCTVES